MCYAYSSLILQKQLYLPSDINYNKQIISQSGVSFLLLCFVTCCECHNSISRFERVLLLCNEIILLDHHNYDFITYAQ